jgi:hypothetical protein
MNEALIFLGMACLLLIAAIATAARMLSQQLPSDSLSAVWMHSVEQRLDALEQAQKGGRDG